MLGLQKSSNEHWHTMEPEHKAAVYGGRLLYLPMHSVLAYTVYKSNQYVGIHSQDQKIGTNNINNI